MPSFQVDQSCYGSALSAVNAMAAREVGRLSVIGNSTYVTDVSATSDTSITYRLTDISTGSALVSVATVSPFPCELLDTGDGLIIAWGIATAWIVTAAVLFLRRGVHE
jgi:hypothetical protein